MDIYLLLVNFNFNNLVYNLHSQTTVPVFVIVINTLGLHLEEFMISVSNAVQPTLLIQIFFLKLFPKLLKGIIMGSPDKLTTAVTSLGTPLVIRSAYTIQMLN